jgi:hypothetical protein
VKIEPNDQTLIEGRNGVPAARLMCSDGSWWAIDSRDPDLESYLKQQQEFTPPGDMCAEAQPLEARVVEKA